MKLKITKSEAIILIRRALNLPVDCVVTIVRDTNPLPKKRSMNRMLVDKIDKLRYSTDQKLEAIKTFRETVPSTLTEAKWAIENWHVVRTWLITNRRLPVLQYFSSDSNGNASYSIS